MADVSIVIVAYPGLPDAHLQQSIASATAQIAVDASLRVYLDGVARPDWLDQQIETVEVPPDLAGKPYAIRELMLREAKTPYIAFWDSDDVYSADRLFRQLATIAESKVPICGADFGFFDDQAVMPESFLQEIGYFQRQIDLLDENYLGMGILTARTDWLQQFLPFPNVIHLDWWLAIRSSQAGHRPIVVPHVLGFYRMHARSLSRRLLQLSAEDFEHERQNKINLLRCLDTGDKNVRRRLEFFEALDVPTQYQSLQDAFVKRTYRNIWGGLIIYAGK